MNQTCAASDVHLRGGLTLPVLGAIRRAGMISNDDNAVQA
jgi:hypothetical protein